MSYLRFKSTFSYKDTHSFRRNKFAWLTDTLLQLSTWPPHSGPVTVEILAQGRVRESPCNSTLIPEDLKNFNLIFNDKIVIKKNFFKIRPSPVTRLLFSSQYNDEIMFFRLWLLANLHSSTLFYDSLQQCEQNIARWTTDSMN